MFAGEYIPVKPNLFQVNALPIKAAESPEITVRKSQPLDVEMIDAMHDRLSKDSLYYRYLVSIKPKPEDMQSLYSFEEGDGLVLVAIVKEPQERIIGIACYKVEPNQSSSAEPAVLVEDNYQGQGIGKQLMSALCQQGFNRGVKKFVSYIHPANHKVIQMIKHSNLPSQSKYADGLMEFQVSLSPEMTV